MYKALMLVLGLLTFAGSDVVQSDPATDFLIERLVQAQGREAVSATEALADRARVDREGLVGREKLFAANLDSQNPNLVAATSDLLEKIKSSAAERALINSWRKMSLSQLGMSAQFRTWSAKPLFYWYLSSISEFDSTSSVQFLSGVAVDTQYPEAIRGASLLQLKYSDYEHKNALYGPALFETAKELASSADHKVAEQALSFIGSW